MEWLYTGNQHGCLSKESHHLEGPPKKETPTGPCTLNTWLEGLVPKYIHARGCPSKRRRHMHFLLGFCTYAFLIANPQRSHLPDKLIAYKVFQPGQCKLLRYFWIHVLKYHARQNRGLKQHTRTHTHTHTHCHVCNPVATMYLLVARGRFALCVQCSLPRSENMPRQFTVRVERPRFLQVPIH